MKGVFTTTCPVCNTGRLKLHFTDSVKCESFVCECCGTVFNIDVKQADQAILEKLNKICQK